MVRTNTSRLAVTALEAREVPSVAAPVQTHPQRFAVGSGAGQAGIVSVYEKGTNAILTTLTPFGPEYTGGVRVATGDLTGDGIDDVTVATATGGGQVKVYDGLNWKLIADFSAFGSTSKGGAYIAVGDVTGDGRTDLVAGAGEGNRPLVRVYRGQDVTTQAAPPVAAGFFAFDQNFLGGVRVAVGDVAGSRVNDILAAPGAGHAPLVKVFAPTAAWGDAGTGAFKYAVTELSVGGKADKGGVFVAAADITGDGRAEVIVGRKVGANAAVTAFNVAGSRPRTVLSAWGFTENPLGGVSVAAHDLDGDGKAEVIAGGGNGTSQVRVIGGRNGGLTRSFMAFAPTYRGGVLVG